MKFDTITQEEVDLLLCGAEPECMPSEKKDPYEIVYDNYPIYLLSNIVFMLSLISDCYRTENLYKYSSEQSKMLIDGLNKSICGNIEFFKYRVNHLEPEKTSFVTFTNSAFGIASLLKKIKRQGIYREFKPYFAFVQQGYTFTKDLAEQAWKDARRINAFSG